MNFQSRSNASVSATQGSGANAQHPPCNTATNATPQHPCQASELLRPPEESSGRAGGAQHLGSCLSRTAPGEH